MGVPKFFRYMSERYPCLSEVIKEYQIPEFDNLYLDMNGIIHNCSHPNDFDPHFRITEKQIFQDIFHYLEVLFRIIQPKKLFFMAIDGVAPRAKMNQQRGRRFRSAKEAEELEEKAKSKGETLPKEKRFDSNCITPGTPFMCRLHAQLRYFVKLKVTTDKLWRNTKVILSGHETPGEGEHKIMDYIRFMKSKPDYNPNLRHCLYGLDADLIMLGLCTHEPYFSLLREEVKFNKSSNKGGSKILTPEETKFFLLHLSLMRDYLELEFEKISKPGVLPFPFDIEKVIDDWVLMGFLVGNDFLPNLPDLHIIDGALPLMFKVYQETLPTLDGYINEGGYLNLKRFEKFMQKLASFDFEQFREKMADIQYIEGKTGRKFKDVFTKEVSKNMDADLAALIKSTDDEFDFRDDELDGSLNYADYQEYYYSDEDDEWRSNFFSEFSQHKTDYYRYKLDYAKVTNDVLRDQAECYIRAIQWNLHYYYNGCASWSWYYPHHYAPYISDIKDFSDLKLTYELGEPFLPFQQLLAVLPAASKELLPKPYQNLMTLENSPILDFYPTEFQTDLNGKKQEWEAVVLIPFIDEKKLIEAMESVEHQLTEEERSRNRHGPMLTYTYSEQDLGIEEAPQYFPPIEVQHALEIPLWRDQIYVHPSKLVKGLCKNVNMNLYRTKFPTLKHLNFTSKIENIKVKVFQQPSRNESVVLTLENLPTPSIDLLADQILGKNILVNYPHLYEIKVVSLFSKNMRISLDKNGSSFVEENTKSIGDMFQLCKKSATDDYYSKQGIVIGDTEIMITGQPVESQKYMFGSGGRVTQKKMYIKSTINFPFQTAVLDSIHQPKYTLAYKTIDDIFYPGCQCYNLSYPYYGSEGTVISTIKDENTFVKLSLKVQQEPDLSEITMVKDHTVYNYMPGYTIASKLSVSPLLLSRITGSIFIISNIESEKKVNVGLNIKFNKKNEEVVGFTKRDENTKKWFYTEKVVTVIRKYMENFPEIFHILRNKSSDDIYMRDEIFPTNGEERLNQLVAWLKEQEHTKAEVRNCGASVVDENIVSLIEREIDSCERSEKRMTLLVKPNLLYIPKPILEKNAPDPDTKFQLFDRVVNVRDCYTVPLGYRGTIIGITQGDSTLDTVYDVLFDRPFPHGIKLRCSDSRGYRLPGQAMINITHGKRLNLNNNPSMKNMSMIKSRVDKNSSYTNITKQPPPHKQQPKKNNVLKENSPPPNTNLLLSPFHNHRPHLSQQSSPGSNVLSRQSPFSANISEQPSPVRDIPQVAANNLSSQVKKTMHIKEPERKDSKSSLEEVSVIINKEERCIFSVPTFPIPTAQPMATMSFFGPSNILDRPEIQNKLFKESESKISSRAATPKQSADVIKKHKEDTNHSVHTSFEDLNSSVQRMRSRTTSRTMSESSENVVCIPSISDLVKQNNITAKTNFGGESSSLQDFICKIQSPDLAVKQSNSQIKANHASLGQTSKDGTSKIFQQAISAMAKQSPQLIESNSMLVEDIPIEVDLDFKVKHAPFESSSQPTIKTEMRKVVKSTSNQQFLDGEEEEVMIIEVKDEKPEEKKPDAYTLQAFFSKLKVNENKDAQALLRDKKVTSLEHIEASVTTPTSVANTSELTNVTSKTINDFFVKEEQKIKARNEVTNKTSLTEIIPDEKQFAGVNVLTESRVSGSDMLKKMLNIDQISPASSLTTSPVADDLSNIKSVSNALQFSTQQSTVSSVQKLLEQHSAPLSNLQANLTTPSQRPIPSAFQSVPPKAKDALTANVPVQNTLVSNHSGSPFTTKSKPLSATAQSFIPPQVQKYHFDKISLPAQNMKAPLQQSNSTSYVPGAPLVQNNESFASGASVQQNNQSFVPQMLPFQSTARGIPLLENQSIHPAPPQVYYQQPPFTSGFSPYTNQDPRAYASSVPAGQFPAVPPNMYPNRQQVLVHQPPLRSDTAAQYVGIPLHQVYYSGLNMKHHQQSQQQFQPSFSHTPSQPTSNKSAIQTSGRVQPLPQQCPQPSWSSYPLNSMTTSTDFVTDEKVDSFVQKLLQLTNHNKLGTPVYSFEMDDAKSYTAVVRIAHPHSEIMVRGKPCTKKIDSAEICARRAFNELAQVYALPVTKNKNKDITSEAPLVASSSQAKRDSVETENNEEKKEEKKQKRPKLAAKFNVSLHSKN